MTLLDRRATIAALARGEVVAVPTDTVYGLAASLDEPAAVAALFELKRRPDSVALPVLVSSLDQISALGVVWPPAARALSEALWPGPLTIVVVAPTALAAMVRATTPAVGLRLPDDPLLADLLEATGPLCVTSANRHGESPAATAAQAEAIFGGGEGFAGVLDGGERRGAVSTVVDLTEIGLTGRWRVLRDGAIPLSRLAELLARA